MNTIEDLLYNNPPFGGFPMGGRLKVFTEFEAGGAYEDWGFVVQLDGKTIAEGRNAKIAIENAYKYFEDNKNKPEFFQAVDASNVLKKIIES